MRSCNDEKKEDVEATLAIIKNLLLLVLKKRVGPPIPPILRHDGKAPLAIHKDALLKRRLGGVVPCNLPLEPNAAHRVGTHASTVDKSEG